MTSVIIRYIIRFFLLILFIFLKTNLEQNESYFGNAYDFLHSIISFLTLFTIVNIVTAALIMAYRLRKNLPYKYTDNVINGFNNLYYIIVVIGIFMMILGFWGIDLKSLFTSLSIVAAALAIISKDYVSGIISGFIISFSKEINIEDYVKIGNHKGKILEINLSKVILLNDDDDIIYIPNDKVFLSDIINYTKREIKKVSIDFELALEHFISIEILENTLAESLKSFHKYIEPSSFNVKIVDVHHEYLSLKFQYKLREVNREIENLIRKKTIRMIANSLKGRETA